jgi:hypothetical protein
MQTPRSRRNKKVEQRQDQPQQTEGEMVILGYQPWSEISQKGETDAEQRLEGARALVNAKLPEPPPAIGISIIPGQN